MKRTMACAGCGRAMEPLERVCGSCGQARSSSSSWRHNPWIILALLFLIVGPLALPLLWKSEGFSAGQKVGVAVLNLIYTAGVIVVIGLLFHMYTTMLLDLSRVE